MTDSPFKKQVAADNEKVFLNDLEFADTHVINGTVCKAVVQNITVTGPVTDVTDILANQIYQDKMQVHVLKSSLPEVPAEGMAFYMDDKMYLVENVSDDMGILTIILSAADR